MNNPDDRVSKLDGPGSGECVETVFRESVGLVPGGSAVVALAELVLRKRDALRAQEFFTRLAPMLGKGSPEDAADFIHRNLEEPAILENVDRGFRQMMDAVDEQARQCVAALIAHYAKRRELPNADYRHVGGILASCEATTLQRLGALLNVYPYHAEASAHRILVKGTTPPDQGLVWFHTGRYLEQHEPRPAPVAHLTFDISDITTLFIQHGVGIPWSGLTGHTGGSSVMTIPSAKDSMLKLLRDCISVGTSNGAPTHPRPA